ncbi:MAG: holo-ACP synthase [Candidatus Omnitrophica bacterium]|nr:holo-ACP synthase [Candidatus Omnitrophota bacterium]
MSVVGVGVDIVKIEKICNAIGKWGDAFLSRVFDDEELAKITKNKLYYQRLAGRFAAKEAVIKAISKSQQFALKDIMILNKPNGAPYCKLTKDIGMEIMLSITHIEDYAVACAVAQKIES